MANGVNIWGIEARFGYKIVEEIMNAWEFLSFNLNERDVDTLNRLKYPGQRGGHWSSRTLAVPKGP